MIDDEFKDYGPAGGPVIRGILFGLAITLPFWIVLGLVLLHFLHTH